MGDEQHLKKKKRIRITTRDLYETVIMIQEMLALAGYSLDEKDLEAVSTIKHEVYKELVRYQTVASHETLMEENASDLALFIIVPIIDSPYCAIIPRKADHIVGL
ncbi:hypothetical protein EV426DRAFT_714355 [Tirmania nivea]|nr:hypothetical protein EV426DRAFT_714355 [Tirmania nivea]